MTRWHDQRMVDPEPERAQVEARSAQRKNRVIPVWSVLASAGVVFGVGAVSTQALLKLYGSGVPPEDVVLEVLKLSLVSVVVAGGFAALLLAVRRQRMNETNLLQGQTHNTASDAQNVVQAQNVHGGVHIHGSANQWVERDEAIGRYSEALGDDKAPVRLSGIYALERFGQSNPDYRQTVVNLLCAYLRMPFTYPDGNEGLPASEIGEQEFSVRVAAQRILSEHLRPDFDRSQAPANEGFWGGIVLDLTGAVLVGFEMSNCLVASANFENAIFHKWARFEGAHFETAWFAGAQFHGWAGFDEAQFREMAGFTGAQFHDDASFVGASFHNIADFANVRFRSGWFWGSCFCGMAGFGGVEFSGVAGFNGMDQNEIEGAHFHDSAMFRNVEFRGEAQFESVRFGGETSFEAACFHGVTRFTGARRRLDVSGVADVWPSGWMLVTEDGSEGRYSEAKEGGWGFVVRADGLSEG